MTYSICRDEVIDSIKMMTNFDTVANPNTCVELAYLHDCTLMFSDVCQPSKQFQGSSGYL